MQNKTYALWALFALLLISGMLLQVWNGGVREAIVESESDLGNSPDLKTVEPVTSSARTAVHTTKSIRIIDRITKLRLAKAKLDVLWHVNRERRSYDTDDKGESILDETGSLSLIVRHEGHADRFRPWIETSRLPIVIEMDPAGTLRVQVRDQNGTPVGGFKGLLMPKICDVERAPSFGWQRRSRLRRSLDPLVEIQRTLSGEVSDKRLQGLVLATVGHMKWEDTPTCGAWLPYRGSAWLVQESDASGVMSWRGIPAGSLVRWGALETKGRMSIQPPFQDPAASMGEGNQANTVLRNPQNLSGSMEIRAGQVAHSRATLMAGNVILGRLSETGLRSPGQAPLVWSQVRISTRHVSMSQATKFVEYQTEQQIDLGNDLDFRFATVSPGRKRIYATARSGVDHWFFTREFDYAGGLHDLGSIVSMQGGCGRLVFRVAGRDDLIAKIQCSLAIMVPDVASMSLELEVSIGKELRFWGCDQARVMATVGKIDTGGTPELLLKSRFNRADMKPKAVVILRVTDRAKWRPGEIQLQFPVSTSGSARYTVIGKDGASSVSNTRIVKGRGSIRVANLDSVKAVYARLRQGSDTYGGFSLGLPRSALICDGNGRLEVTLGGRLKGKVIGAIPEELHRAGIRNGGKNISSDPVTGKGELDGLNYPETYILVCGDETMKVTLKGSYQKVAFPE